jgi:hypothetical protein
MNTADLLKYLDEESASESGRFQYSPFSLTQESASLLTPKQYGDNSSMILPRGTSDPNGYIPASAGKNLILPIIYQEMQKEYQNPNNLLNDIQKTQNDRSKRLALKQLYMQA